MSVILRFMRERVREYEKGLGLHLSFRAKSHLVRILAGHVRDRELFDHHAFQLINAGAGSNVVLDTVKYRRMVILADRIVLVSGWFPSVLKSRRLNIEKSLILAEQCYQQASHFWARTGVVRLANRIFVVSDNIHPMLDVLQWIRLRMSDDMRHALAVLEKISAAPQRNRIIT